MVLPAGKHAGEEQIAHLKRESTRTLRMGSYDDIPSKIKAASSDFASMCCVLDKEDKQ